MRRRILLAGALAVSIAGPALAEDYPNRPIMLIVPFPAGGGTDLIGRELAEAMRAALGVPVTVENIGGAAGLVGGLRAARSAPDGYTLLLAADQVAATGTMKEARYDGTKDLVGLAPVSVNYMSLVAGPGLKAQDLMGAIAEMKAAPGKIAFGSPGFMSSPHLAGEVFQRKVGVQLLHVPYQGGGPAMVDVMAGRVPLLVSTFGQAIGTVKSGKLRMLVVFSEQRLPALPDVPTARELGIDLVMSSFTGVFAPKGVPAPIAAKLAKTVADIVQSPAFDKKLAAIGVLPAPDTSAAYLQRIVAEADANMRAVFP